MGMYKGVQLTVPVFAFSSVMSPVCSVGSDFSSLLVTET